MGCFGLKFIVPSDPINYCSRLIVLVWFIKLEGRSYQGSNMSSIGSFYFAQPPCLLIVPFGIPIYLGKGWGGGTRVGVKVDELSILQMTHCRCLISLFLMLISNVRRSLSTMFYVVLLYLYRNSWYSFF
ncbi:hypothetical protein DM860_008896 [Cuscuta australis]|uniref:Uncharacterized protein n=1 Tax=Cuscuta australis TaxID=267555 RepID=A0A328D8F1_9ASTE|nr:hypothetical protein DM860_008896 [Cuscuta australis]